MDFSFPKRERIVSQKLIDELFGKQGSQSMVAFPIRAVYKVSSHPSPLNPQPSTLNPQILISVPKKKLHHAVDRNRVKRQLREAWRHNRQPLMDILPEGQNLLVAFVWLSDRHFSSGEVALRMKKLIGRMAASLHA